VVDQQTKDNVTRKGTWLRFLYMILFAVIFNIAEFVVVVVVIVQFITKLFTGDVHKRLVEFADNVAQYLADIVRYLAFRTEELPYPFGDWPGTPPAKSRKKAAAAEKADAPAPPPPPPPPVSPPPVSPPPPPTGEGQGG
jgi:hypothetical protein